MNGELVKWLALALMTGDHVNAALFGRELPVLSELGRVVMPLFAFVLAYNMARPGGLDSGRYGRAVRRLVLVGALAQPIWLALGVVLPLNILFTFAAAIGCMWAIDAGRPLLAAVVFVIAGAAVDYLWPGVGLTLAAWWYWRTGGSLAACVAVAAALGGLCLVNGSWWALWSVPLLGLLVALPWRVPRIAWAFYAYYPAHLAALALAVGV